MHFGEWDPASLDQFPNSEDNNTVFVDMNHLDIQGESGDVNSMAPPSFKLPRNEAGRTNSSQQQSNRKLTPSTFLYNIDRAAQRIHTMGQLKQGPSFPAA